MGFINQEGKKRRYHRLCNADSLFFLQVAGLSNFTSSTDSEVMNNCTRQSNHGFNRKLKMGVILNLLISTLALKNTCS